MSRKPIIICHGGAGSIETSRQCGKMCGIKEAVKAGYKALAAGGLTAIDAVEVAINSMEADQFFNAGYGSTLTDEGLPELEASIMDGKDLSVGSTALISVVKQPISLARKIKERSPHNMLCGEGASAFAKSHGIEIVPTASLVSEYSRQCLKAFQERNSTEQPFEFEDTVGCVAMDKDGNIAAGTSAGGINGKGKGRIGHTPIIGCGTYADNKLGGVSCTGHGETIMRVVLAHTICNRLGEDPIATQAIQFGVQKVEEIHGKTVGAITISKEGDVGVHFNAPMMPWAYIKDEKMHFGLKPDQDYTKRLEDKDK